MLKVLLELTNGYEMEIKEKIWETDFASETGQELKQKRGEGIKENVIVDYTSCLHFIYSFIHSTSKWQAPLLSIRTQ